MTKQDEFLIKLKELMAEYEVEIEESPDYNGRDEYCGSYWLFVSVKNGIHIDIKEL